MTTIGMLFGLAVMFGAMAVGHGRVIDVTVGAGFGFFLCATIAEIIGDRDR